MPAELYFEATPAPYEAAIPRSGKGFIYTAEGLGELDFGITGIVANTENPFCAAPEGIGYLDNYSGFVKEFTTQELSIEYIRQGERITERLDFLQGIDPLRTLFISDSFGADVSGGLTIYGVEVDATITEAIYIGIASRRNIKEDFNFQKWVKIKYPAALARPIVSGREFKLLLFTVGAGRFTIKGIKVWCKLTDRRGFNTGPQKGEAQSDH
jgi:hypothetical protein